MSDIKQKAREMFDEKFGDNYVWWQECINEMRIGDPDFNRLKSFIDQIIDIAIAERDKEIVEIIHETLGNDWSDMHTLTLVIQRIINLSNQNK